MASAAVALAHDRKHATGAVLSSVNRTESMVQDMRRFQRDLDVLHADTDNALARQAGMPADTSAFISVRRPSPMLASADAASLPRVPSFKRSSSGNASRSRGWGPRRKARSTAAKLTRQQDQGEAAASSPSPVSGARLMRSTSNGRAHSTARGGTARRNSWTEFERLQLQMIENGTYVDDYRAIMPAAAPTPVRRPQQQPQQHQRLTPLPSAAFHLTHAPLDLGSGPANRSPSSAPASPRPWYKKTRSSKLVSPLPGMPAGSSSNPYYEAPASPRASYAGEDDTSRLVFSDGGHRRHSKRTDRCTVM